MRVTLFIKLNNASKFKLQNLCNRVLRRIFSSNTSFKSLGWLNSKDIQFCVCLGRYHSSSNFMALLQCMTTMHFGMDLSRLRSSHAIYC